MHALVLIGRSLTHRDSDDVAAAAAAILGMSEGEFAARVIAAAPATVRESSDLTGLEALCAQLAECGIDAAIAPSDGIPWQIELDGVARGPVPLAWIEAEVRAARLDPQARVRRAGNPTWIPLSSVVARDASADADTLPVGSDNALPPDMLEAARIFVDANHAFYLRSWGVDGAGRRAWNWAAFLLGPTWLLYRKMYRPAFAWLAFVVVEGWVESRLEVSMVLSYSIGIAANVVIACVGNALYRKHFERAIRTLSPGRDPASLRVELAREGGTSLGAAIALTVLFALVTMGAGLLGVSAGID